MADNKHLIALLCDAKNVHINWRIDEQQADPIHKFWDFNEAKKELMELLRSDMDTVNILCDCVNVAVGSYGNQVMVPRPIHMRGRKEGTESDIICIDTCLANEIMYLWKMGVTTTGCCCGHKKFEGYIGVIDSDGPLMETLGYKVNLMAAGPNNFIPLGVRSLQKNMSLNLKKGKGKNVEPSL